MENYLLEAKLNNISDDRLNVENPCKIRHLWVHEISILFCREF